LPLKNSNNKILPLKNSNNKINKNNKKRKNENTEIPTKVEGSGWVQNQKSKINLKND